MFRGKSSEKGFSLVEILIVIVMLGILSSIAIPIFTNQQKDAKDAQIKSHLNALNISLSTAKTSDVNSLYPDELPYDGDIRPSGAEISYVQKDSNRDYCIRGEIIGSPYLYFTNASGVITVIDNNPETRDEAEIAAAEAACVSDETVKPVLLEGYLDADQHGVLTWNNIGADSYNLRSISGDNISITVGNTDSSSHMTVRTENPLTLKTVFIVEAFRGGNSSLSNEVTLSPTQMRPPTTNLYIKNITSLNAEGKTLEQIKADNGVPADQPLFHHFTPYLAKATLYWDEVAWAQEYIVYKNGTEIYRGTDLELEITADLNALNDSYVVRVYNSVGTSADSNVVNFSGPTEGAPFLYTANRLGNTSLWTDEGKTETLLWTSVPGATSYQVYVSSNNSNFQLLDTVAAQSLVVDVQWGTGNYYYYVRALGADATVNSNKVELSRLHPVMQAPVLTSTLVRNNTSALTSAVQQYPGNASWENAVRNNAGVNSTWTAVPYARSYEYRYRNASGEWSSILTSASVRQIPSVLKIGPNETMETQVRAKGWGEHYSPWASASPLLRPVPAPVLVSNPTVRGRAVSNTNFIEGQKADYACIPETDIQFKARNNAGNARPLPSSNSYYVTSKTAEGNKPVIADWYRSVGRDVTENGGSDTFGGVTWNSIPWSTVEPATPAGATGQRVLEQWNYRCATTNGGVSPNVEDTAFFKPPREFNTPIPSGTVYQLLGMEHPTSTAGLANYRVGMKNAFNTQNQCAADSVIENEVAYKYGLTGTVMYSISTNRWSTPGSSVTPGMARNESNWFTYQRANYTPNWFKKLNESGWRNILRAGLHGNGQMGYWHWEDTYNNRRVPGSSGPEAFHSAPVVFNSRCSNNWGDGDSQFEFTTSTSYAKYNVAGTSNFRVLRLDQGGTSAGYKVVPYFESFCRMNYPNRPIPTGAITQSWIDQETANVPWINNPNNVIADHLNQTDFLSKISNLKTRGANSKYIVEINPILRNGTEISSTKSMHSACAPFTNTSYFRGSSTHRLAGFSGAHGIATDQNNGTVLAPDTDLVRYTGPWGLYRYQGSRPPLYGTPVRPVNG